MKNDKEKIANKRKMNIVYGEIAPTISRWFGDNPLPVEQLIEEAGLSKELNKQLTNLSVGRNHSIPQIKDETTVKKLYRIVMLKTKPSITKYECTTNKRA